ncbi:MAG: serine/threonine-protein kinase [Phycisphaerae bacterium]|nr:serine/threonine protein kinase [Phycisphaerae bacterium]MCZ2401588.1 serine/threonine-protein kinase [Phycisphaerae bacterium]
MSSTQPPRPSRPAGDADPLDTRPAAGGEATLPAGSSAGAGLGRSGALHDETIRASPPPLIGTTRADLAPGTRIDAYTVLSVLGRGGMGVVYRAEQDHPRRTVALKLLRRGLMTAELVNRFEFEVQVLGRLQHPGIAQVYEAGTIDVGDGPQPYFAMELIEGRPLSAFVADHRYGLRQRLELFARICDAVQHAHTKGVIHRDLKPANILVTAEGQPRILDFGVARVIGDEAAHTLATTVGQLVGTVPYMSPEQIAGDPRELDTRTDVYSLGVILYEMLAGRLPYDLAHKPLPEAARIIRDEEPPRLSSVNQAIGGDIEWVVRRALEKERGRRYETASDLAADVRRFLADQPLLARPPSAWYLFAKFSRRNRAAVVATGVVAVALVGGLVALSWLLARTLKAERDASDRLAEVSAARAAEQEAREQAEAESRRAQLEAETTAAVNTFLNTVLASADPARGGREMTVREALDNASKDLGALAGRPLIEAAVRSTIARSYRALGLAEAAEGHARAAYELRQKVLGESAAATLESLNDLASILQDQSRLEQAEGLFRAALPLYERTLGPEAPETLTTRNNLGMLLIMRGSYPEAEEHLRAALAGQRKNPGNEHLATLDTISNLSILLQFEGKLEEAETLARESLATRRRVFGNRHPGTLVAVNNLGTLLSSLGKSAEAEPLYFESLELSRDVLGPEHPETLTSLTNCAGLLRDRGELDRAEQMYREALALRDRTLGPGHADTIDNRRALAMMLAGRSRLDEADGLLAAALSAARESLGDEHPDTLACLHGLGRLRLLQKRPAEAEALLREAAETAARTMGPQAWRPAQFDAARAEALLDLGRPVEAEPLLLAAHERLSAALGADHYHTRYARDLLARLYEQTGRGDQAARWRN